MSKRRGYYEIEVGGQKITGHFSVNFWALLEESMGFNSLGETFAFMAKGVGMSQIRQIIYCSTLAYCQENEIAPYYTNIFKCGEALEDFTEEHMIKVMEAFAESKLLGNDVNFGIERSPKAETEDESSGESGA